MLKLCQVALDFLQDSENSLANAVVVENMVKEITSSRKESSNNELKTLTRLV